MAVGLSVVLAILIPSWRAWSSSRPEEPSPSTAYAEQTREAAGDGTTAQAPTPEWSVAEEAERQPSGAPQAPQDERPEPLARGRLVVYAEPWGNVWINGEQVGRSPFRERFKPGLYTVQVGDTYPEAKKRVRISPGKTREVLIQREALR
jgi:hypothetical protein